ncbi:hypothetical protein TBR22_A12280 [Luteitalea sp. TBR-22]|nr:hypothetical protein TBR22_A12280 [Luteitalea sp. TBR-22]
MVATGLRMIEPPLDRLAGGAGMVARRHQVLVDRSPAADGAMLRLVSEIRKVGQIVIAIASSHGRTIDPLASRFHAFNTLDDGDR